MGTSHGRGRHLRSGGGIQVRWAKLATAGALVSALLPAQVSIADQSLPMIREVDTVWTSELGMAHPTGITYRPDRDQILVASPEGGDTIVIDRDASEYDPRPVRLTGLPDPSGLTFSSSLGSLVATTDGGLVSIAEPAIGGGTSSLRPLLSTLKGQAQGATSDPASNRSFFLFGNSVATVDLPAGGHPSIVRQVSLRGFRRGTLSGLAFNPADGLLYIGEPGRGLLHAVNTSGVFQKSYNLAGLELTDIQAMTFAPSIDATDKPSTQHLFIAAKGNQQQAGAVVEATLEPLVVAAAVTTVQAVFVQAIPAYQWSPASPDPSGIAYVPSRDHLFVVDSEVDETTGAGWHGVNLWETTRLGSVTDTGATHPRFSREPTGLAYNPGNNTLFISDDDAKRIWMIQPGPDNRFGTADDPLSFLSTSVYSIADTEDPTYDTTTGKPTSGHLFFLDGSNTEVHDVDPVDGVFGNGNDAHTHFDIGVLGSTDYEGLASDPGRDILAAGARKDLLIFEMTKTGTLLRVIDANAIPGLRRISGLALAPASDGSGKLNYWIVDRATDNGSNSSENDGMVFEITVPGTDSPPVANAGPDQTVNVLTATIDGSASTDDVGISTYLWQQTAGTTASIANTAAASTGVTLPAFGSYTFQLTVTDGAGLTAIDSVVVTAVNNTDIQPPVANAGPDQTVNVLTATIDGSASTDDVGISTYLWQQTAGTTASIANTAAASTGVTLPAFGSYTFQLTVTDGAGLTAIDSVVVTAVDNTAPTVSIGAPTAGATVSGTVAVTATATDDGTVTQVEFFDGTSTIGIDNNSAGGWSVNWNTTPATPGGHSLTATASDTATNTATSAPVTVTVDNTAPTVSITSPAPGDVSGTITVTATAAADVTQVAFFVDGTTSIGVDNSSASGWSVSWDTTTATPGSHSLTATASDAAGNSATSTAVAVNVSNSGSFVLTTAVAVGADDAEQKASGSMNLTSSDLDMVLDSSTTITVGLRFIGINIPTTATITSAYIQFRSDEVGSAVTNLTIQGQLDPNPVGFATTRYNIRDRLLRTDPVVWNPVLAWNAKNLVTDAQKTPDLKLIVQQLISQGGWSSGNAMVFIIGGTGQRTADSFEGGYAPRLIINYTLP